MVLKISVIVNESVEIKDKSLIMVAVVVSCFANQTYPSPSKNGFIQLYRYLLCLWSWNPRWPTRQSALPWVLKRLCHTVVKISTVVKTLQNVSYSFQNMHISDILFCGIVSSCRYWYYRSRLKDRQTCWFLSFLVVVLGKTDIAGLYCTATITTQNHRI